MQAVLGTTLTRGITRGPRGEQSPGALSLWGRRMTTGWPKSHNNVTSTFFNTLHLLPKYLMFERGGAKLASCPGRHLTSLRADFNTSVTIAVKFRKHSVHQLKLNLVC